MWNLIVSVPDHCLSFYFYLFGSHFDLYQSLNRLPVQFIYYFGPLRSAIIF